MLLSFRCSGLTEGIPWFSRAHERRLRVKDGPNRQRRFSDGLDYQDGETVRKRIIDGVATVRPRQPGVNSRQLLQGGKKRGHAGGAQGEDKFTRCQGLTCFRGDLARSQAAQCPTRFAPVAFPIPLHPMPSKMKVFSSGRMRNHRCGHLPSR